MYLSCHCPVCEQPIRIEIGAAPAQISCTACGQMRAVPENAVRDGVPTRCLGCGNSDLWRQKDFPQRLGLIMVAMGAIFSSIAWGYHRPVLALSILGAFAITDMVLFWVMPDVLVCYRCRARHRVSTPGEDFQPYNHELGERYRQERIRMEQEQSSGRAPSPS